MGCSGAADRVAVPLVLAGDRRIDEAGDVVVAHPPPEAQLVAGDARADVLGPAFARLAGEMRVGDLSPDDRHQVGFPGGEHHLGILRRLDTRLHGHFGVRHDLLEGRGVVAAQKHLVVEARNDLGKMVEIAARADGEIVDQAALVEIADDLLLVGEAEAARIGLGARNRHADDERLADLAADARGNFRDEPQAVVERASPFVGAPVGDGRPELVDEAVVAREQIGAVEAGVAVAARRGDEGIDELFDLRLAHGVASPRIVEGGVAGGRPVGLPAVVLIAVPPDMVELVHHDRAVGVAFIGDLAEMRDHLVALGKEIPANEDAGPMRRGGLHHDHGGPSPRPLAVVAEVTGPRDALVAHVDRMRAEDDAVLERDVAELEGREQRRVGLRHGAFDRNHGRRRSRRNVRNPAHHTPAPRGVKTAPARFTGCRSRANARRASRRSGNRCAAPRPPNCSPS